MKAPSAFFFLLFVFAIVSHDSSPTEPFPLSPDLDNNHNEIWL